MIFGVSAAQTKSELVCTYFLDIYKVMNKLILRTKVFENCLDKVIKQIST